MMLTEEKMLPKKDTIMNEAKESVLVIDDDSGLCELLAEYLTPEGFAVKSSRNGETGIEMALAGEYSIIVLDVMLPGKHNGFDVLRSIRAKKATPVLMLTARGEDVDRIVGLEMGADDYLPKPFNPRELLARISAIIRRAKSLNKIQGCAPITGICKIDDIELNPNARAVLRGGNRIDLTSVEFNLLELLMRNAGNLVTRDALAADVLGRSLSPYDRSIDVHISRLRKKLARDGGEPDRIKAIRGAGYIYVSS